jgi:hypothetical protein
MKTQYEYLVFVNVPDSIMKTSVWNCNNRKSGETLGVVKWYSGWRQYCYFPCVQAIYSEGCLKDIIDFINQLKEDRK